jgi:hypothetical protein
MCIPAIFRFYREAPVAAIQQNPPVLQTQGNRPLHLVHILRQQVSGLHAGQAPDGVHANDASKISGPISDYAPCLFFSIRKLKTL